MKFNQFAAFLFYKLWMISGNEQQVYGNERPPDCCLTVKNIRIPAENILAYSIQEAPSCGIKAVKFYTKKNRIICSDPNSDWAKTVIQKLCLTPAHKNIECHANSVQTTTATHKIPGFTLLPTENGPDSTDNKTSVHHSSRLNKIFRPRKKKVLRKIQMGVSRMQEDGPPVSCCRLGDIRPHLDKILNYTIQTEEMCSIRAVLFQTVTGKTLCSDPESSWTKSAMWKVDEEQRKLREQDTVAAEGASVDGRKGREDPMTTAEMPINSRVTTTTMKSKEQPPDCCLTVTNIRMPLEQIVAYSLQEPPLCSIKAVRFYTKKGKVICSDSNSNWAKTVIVTLRSVIVQLRSTAEPHKETTQGHTTETIQTTTATDTSNTVK